MRHILIIVISLLLFTFTLFGQSKVIGVLYQYKTTSSFIWKTFGKGKVQPKYMGEIKNGKMDGLGVLIYPHDGESIVGEWKNGKRTGQGTLSYPDGGVRKGIWKNNKLIEPN